MSDGGLTGLRAAVNALGELSRAVANGAAGAGDDRGLAELAERCARHRAGGRVLIVADRARAEAIELAVRGAREVLAWPGPWQDLDPEREGSFAVVCCEGVLERVLDPMALLLKLRTIVAPNGLLLLGSTLLADPERSEYLRFAPTGHTGDPSPGFMPGRLALRWMVQTAGFEVQEEFGEREGPREGFPLVHAFLRARPLAAAQAEPSPETTVA
jgi:SAM-dependent methyltransferase